MKVLLDGTVFGNGFQKGIQRYVRELVAHSDADVSLMHDHEGCITVPHALSDHVLKPFLKRLPRKNIPLRIWRSSQRRISIEGFDVYHTPYMGVSPNKRMPSVMVVHDMVCERFPEYFVGDASWESRRKKKAMDAATLLIAISQATADDLLYFYPEFADRIRVVHHGAEHLSQLEPSNSLITQNKPPYALFVGDRVGYKNFKTVLLAMVEPNWPDEILLKVAGPPPSDEELGEVRSMALDSKIAFLSRVDDSTLVDLYKQADCFLFPSLHEGFGFPLIEAQKCGTPVVASNIPVFMEIGGNGFEPFDPLDPASLAHAVSKVLDSVQSTALRRTGYENSMKFSWKTTAYKTTEVWREAIHQ